MTIESLLKRLEANCITAVTATTKVNVTKTTEHKLGCTSVTSVTQDFSKRKTFTTSHLDSPLKAHTRLPASEEAIIRAWLSYIREDDPCTIKEVLEAVIADPIEKARLLAHAKEELRLVNHTDERRYCDQCKNILINGHCLAAIRKNLGKPGLSAEPRLSTPLQRVRAKTRETKSPL